MTCERDLNLTTPLNKIKIKVAVPASPIQSKSAASLKNLFITIMNAQVNFQLVFQQILQKK